jgi:hypothetical protein
MAHVRSDLVGICRVIDGDLYNPLVGVEFEKLIDTSQVVKRGCNSIFVTGTGHMASLPRRVIDRTSR